MVVVLVCSRCRVLLHVLDGTSPDPVGDYKAIQLELELFNPALLDKPQVRATLWVCACECTQVYGGLLHISPCVYVDLRRRLLCVCVSSCVGVYV